MNYKTEQLPTLFPAMQNPTHRLIAEFDVVTLKEPVTEKKIMSFIDANIDHPQLEEAITKSDKLKFWVGKYIDSKEGHENRNPVGFCK